MKQNPNNRFQVVFEEKLSLSTDRIRILKDTLTGVLYTQPIFGSSCGALSPVLDKDGKPIVDTSIPE